ncbi:Centrosomal protein of 89 kDa [Bagarius yarrelli]|uniref:Centrosomal protein of 89 kDa n=1 Tax=Bagarius yarrelli TaxID=175774 RepID=A0A556VVP1_BAGYA|nr:Centrosomal protein of 89 kDa [Bagarius yarrelli]
MSKQIMLLEAEKQTLESEFDVANKELCTLKMKLQKASLALENSVSCVEHTTTTDKLKWKLEEEEKIKCTEIQALQDRVATLLAEKKTLLLEKKAQRRIDLLKQQIKDSFEKELVAYQELTSIVVLAEKTMYERDQLKHMASCLTKDKQGIITQILDGNIRLGKLQEKVKSASAEAVAYALAEALAEPIHETYSKASGHKTHTYNTQSNSLNN